MLMDDVENYCHLKFGFNFECEQENYAKNSRKDLRYISYIIRKSPK